MIRTKLFSFLLDKYPGQIDMGNGEMELKMGMTEMPAIAKMVAITRLGKLCVTNLVKYGPCTIGNKKRQNKEEKPAAKRRKFDVD